MNYFERVIKRVNDDNNRLVKTVDGYKLGHSNSPNIFNLQVYGERIVFKGTLIPLTPKQVEDVHTICDASYEKRRYLMRESILKEL